MPALITLTDVSLAYGHVKAVANLSRTIEEGALTALTGPNGAGKSTLLKAIAGILKPVCGSIALNEVAEHHTAYLPQASSLQKDYPFTVLQTALTGLWPEIGNTGRITKAHKARARAVLAQVGLQGLEERQIGTLSGGQFQRLLFARVIMQDAKLILLDEPFTGIDSETTDKLIQILQDWHAEGRTVICVLHDQHLIQTHFPDHFPLLPSGQASAA